MKRWPLLLGAAALATSVSCMARAEADIFPRPVQLTVELPQPAQKLLYVHEVMPVEAGALTLYYPKYIPGDHGPDGPIDTMMGLQISAGGKRIARQRDAVDMFTFHLVVPPGVKQIDIRVQFPESRRITSNLMGITWDHVALYRAAFPRKPTVRQPAREIPDERR